MRTLARSIPLGILLLLGLSTADADPPARVGRLSLIEGEVTLHDRRTGETAPATLNWPVTGGTAISVAPGARAEVRVGSTAIRIDGATDLDFVRLDDQATRLWLGQGAVSVRVRGRDIADGFELETTQGRVLLSDAGRYRFDASPRAETSAASVFQGAAHVDAGGVVVAVQSGKRAEIGRAGAVRLVEAFADDFDAWTLARDRRDDASRSTRYVSPETTGYESLDEYGDWRDTPEYGPVWYPHAVPAGWAPYRWGRWAWIEPWGWTWVDEARWGFAPYHYGRWALVGGVWGWVPGAFVARPVYAPALVGWIGRPGWSVTVSIGAVPAVGWFPLAPREVFVPAYRCSTTYVRNINVTHVTNIAHLTNVTDVTHARFAHRHVERAVTVVPASAITAGQHVARSIVHVRAAELAAAAPGSNAPPAAPARPPRQWSDARPARDDARPARGPQPLPAPPQVNATPTAPIAPPVSAAVQPPRSDARPPLRDDRDTRREQWDRRPEPRAFERATATPQPAPSVAAPPPPRAPERPVVVQPRAPNVAPPPAPRAIERATAPQPPPIVAAPPPPRVSERPVVVQPPAPNVAAPSPPRPAEPASPERREDRRAGQPRASAPPSPQREAAPARPSVGGEARLPPPAPRAVLATPQIALPSAAPQAPRPHTEQRPGRPREERGGERR
jgi:hypothetical protein